MTHQSDTPPWLCAGCGVETAHRIRNCDCPTGCLYRRVDGKRESSTKIEPTEAIKWLIPLAVILAAYRVRADAANTMQHSTTHNETPRLMCRVAVKDVGLVLAWIDQHRAALEATDE